MQWVVIMRVNNTTSILDALSLNSEHRFMNAAFLQIQWMPVFSASMNVYSGSTTTLLHYILGI